METTYGASTTPDKAPGEVPEPGRSLSPTTAGVIRQALQHYLADDRDFVEAFFPNVSARGRANYDDVFSLTARQAAALVPMMESSVRYYQKLDGRDRNRNLRLIERTPIDPAFRSVPSRKAEMWIAALADLCSTFKLVCPV